MKLIEASYYILDKGSTPRYDDLQKIINAYGVCYQAERGRTYDLAKKWLQEKIRAGHESPLEHVSVSVSFTCDRAIANELVRHRIASFTQESTRYCNYSKDKFGRELTFIKPLWYKENAPDDRSHAFLTALYDAEMGYLAMLDYGAKPEEARAVLPLCLKTELVMTANLREWRHIFQLRAADMTGKAHPQMKELMVPLLDSFIKMYPGIFDDIKEYITKNAAANTEGQ